MGRGRFYGGNKPVRVTLSDPETDEVLESVLVYDDYCLITAGNRYVKSIQVMGRTHMLAVAVAPSSPTPQETGR